MRVLRVVVLAAVATAGMTGSAVAAWGTGLQIGPLPEDNWDHFYLGDAEEDSQGVTTLIYTRLSDSYDPPERIYAQKIGPDGVPGERVLIDETTNVSAPPVTSSIAPNDDIVVVWGGAEPGARVIHPDGELEPGHPIPGIPSAIYGPPSMATDADGVSTVARTRRVGGVSVVELVRLDESGELIGTIDVPGSEGASEISVAVDAQDQVTVAWMVGSPGSTLKMARVSEGGEPGEPIDVADGTSITQPRLAVSESGVAALVWQSTEGGSSAVSLARAGSDDSVDPPTVISETGVQGRLPDVDVAGENFVVAWADSQIRSLSFVGMGGPSGDRMVYGNGTATTLKVLDVETSTGGAATVVWGYGTRNSASLYANEVNTSGEPLGAAQIDSNTGGDTPTPTRIVNLSSGVAWNVADGGYESPRIRFVPKAVSAFDVAPPSHDFGEAPFGTAKTFTIHSTGSVRLHVQSITQAGQLGLQKTDCEGKLIPAGGSCQFTARFNFGSPGPRTTSITVTTDAAADPVKTIPISGTGIAPAISVTPSAIAFDPRTASSGPSEPKLVTIKSTGALPLGINSVYLSDTGSFSVAGQSQCTTHALPPDSECQVEVRFDPKTPGAKSATLSVQTDYDSVMQVSLSGVGKEPASAEILPGSHSFGDRSTFAGPSAPVAFEIESTGAEPLRLSSLELIDADADQFTLDGGEDCLNVDIVSGEGCEFHVAFDPDAVGVKSAHIRASANTSSGVVTAAVTGTGTSPAVTVDPQSVDFGALAVGFQSDPASVTIRSSGSAQLELESISISGPDGDQFLLGSAGDCLLEPLQPSSECEIEVGFSPTETGSVGAELEVETAEIGTETVPLAGTGANWDAVISPDGHSFGDRRIDQGPSTVQSFTIESTGGVPLPVSAVELTGQGAGEFVLSGESGCLEEDLAPSDECEIEVAFDPSSAGSKQARLSVEADSAEITSVALSGTGTVPDAAIVPTSHEFSDRITGDGPSETVPFAIQSSGNAPLLIDSVRLEGVDPGQFVLTGAEACVGVELDPGQQCEVEVAFDPSSVGVKSAELVAETDSLVNESVSASLTGRGVAEIAGKPLLTMRANASSKRVKRRKPFAISVRVDNKGNAAAKQARVCAAKGIKVIRLARRCFQVGRIEPGQSRVVKIRARVAPRVRSGRRIAVKVSVTAVGVSVSRVARVVVR